MQQRQLVPTAVVLAHIPQPSSQGGSCTLKWTRRQSKHGSLVLYSNRWLSLLHSFFHPSYIGILCPSPPLNPPSYSALTFPALFYLPFSSTSPFTSLLPSTFPATIISLHPPSGPTQLLLLVKAPRGVQNDMED